MKTPVKHRVFSVAAAALAALTLSAAMPRPAAAQHWNDGAPFSISPGFRLLSGNDRIVLRNFMVNERERQCGQNETAGPTPSGLEPCGVASHVIRYYQPGTILPDWVSDQLVPQRVTAYVTPAPQGAAYVYSQDAVYLMDVLSRRILDVVTLPTD